MNFEFSADQMQLKDIARKFLEKEEAVKRARNVLEGEASYDEDLWAQIIEMGFTATAIPEEYGGLGLGYLELCVIAEELGRSLAPTPFSSSVYLATEAILNYGDDSLKQAYLPGFASGEKIGAFAHSESNTSPTEANINWIKHYANPRGYSVDHIRNELYGNRFTISHSSTKYYPHYRMSDAKMYHILYLTTAHDRSPPAPRYTYTGHSVPQRAAPA